MLRPEVIRIWANPSQRKGISERSWQQGSVAGSGRPGTRLGF